MTTLYLTCFTAGFVLSLLAALSGFGHVHLGHIHLHAAHTHAKAGGTRLSGLNGFTVAAFLCWFGGAGYLLVRYSLLAGAIVLAAALMTGAAGSTLIYGLIFKLLIPRERVLRAEETRMEGTLARVSHEVRALDGTGEILFSQAGVRRSAPARSDDGSRILRDAEVVVLRYEQGIAYVRPLHEPSSGSFTFTSN